METTTETTCTADDIRSIIDGLDGPDWGAPLYSEWHDGPGEVHLEIDLLDGAARIVERAPHENGLPAAVWHGSTRWIGIDPRISKGALVTALEVAIPDLETAVAGAESYQDGNFNWRVTLDKDAQNAIERLEGIGGDQAQVWTASEWLDGNSLEDLGITAKTTDEELKAIEAHLEGTAEDEKIVLVGDLERYLEFRRENAIEEAEEAEAA